MTLHDLPHQAGTLGGITPGLEECPWEGMFIPSFLPSLSIIACLHRAVAGPSSQVTG